jgi:hypothetical protein
MADPAFYRGPSDDIARARQRYEELIPELEKMYARWEDLEARATATP